MKTYYIMLGAKEHTCKAENKTEAVKKFKAKFHTTKISDNDVRVKKDK